MNPSTTAGPVMMSRFTAAIDAGDDMNGHFCALWQAVGGTLWKYNNLMEYWMNPWNDFLMLLF